VKKIKGKIVIDFGYQENKCSWDMPQEGPEELDSDNLIYLFQSIIGDLIEKE